MTFRFHHPNPERSRILVRLTVYLALVFGLFPALDLLATSPADLERSFQLGRGRYQQGLYDQALPFLEEVRRGSPDPEMLQETLIMLGECFRLGGDYAQGSKCYGELLDRFPRNQWRRAALLGHNAPNAIVPSLAAFSFDHTGIVDIRRRSDR